MEEAETMRREMTITNGDLKIFIIDDFRETLRRCLKTVNKSALYELDIKHDKYVTFAAQSVWATSCGEDGVYPYKRDLYIRFVLLRHNSLEQEFDGDFDDSLIMKHLQTYIPMEFNKKFGHTIYCNGVEYCAYELEIVKCITNLPDRSLCTLKLKAIRHHIDLDHSVSTPLFEVQ